MKPVCSVIIAAYNEQTHLGACLKSLLSQSFSPLEIIVVDDGSTDETAVVAMEYPGVRVFTRPHLGKAAAVNYGAREAQGDVLFFLDGDMIFEVDYVARMIAPILNGKAVGTAHAKEFVANPDNRWSACFQRRAGLPPRERLRLTDQNQVEGSPVFRAVKRDLFVQAGGFDHTGYLDDQTLSPKIGRKAEWVANAVCYHYNPETLREVYQSGTWGGKSLALRYGLKMLVTYFPLVIPFRALKRKRWIDFVYEAAYDLGVFCGGARYLFRLDKGHGK